MWQKIVNWDSLAIPATVPLYPTRRTAYNVSVLSQVYLIMSRLYIYSLFMNRQLLRFPNFPLQTKLSSHEQ